MSEKLGAPGVFPTDANFPEEKFRLHAMRNAAYVNPLPRGFGADWHLQYSFFTDKKFPVFDDLALATKVIQQIEDATAAHDDDNDKPTSDGSDALSLGSATAPVAVGGTVPDHVFTSYLIRNVRRIDERTTHVWMGELASGKRSIQELVQAYGVPFKQWRPVPNVSKCPLLECVVRYRPGYFEATWFIRLNVIYTEMNEIKRDCGVRLGDWFYNPRRLQRRSQGWTDQLIDYLHSVARQASKAAKKSESDAKAAAAAALAMSASASGNKGKRLVLAPRHGDASVNAADSVASAAAVSSPQLSFHEKWSYVLKLSEYQYHLGLLDRFRYFDGLTSLLQKALSPRSHSSSHCASVVSIGVNETMELLTVLQKLLPELLRCADSTILLVKSVVQHLRYLVPPGETVPSELGSVLHEELVTALCQLLRDILLNGYDILVRMEDGGT